MDCYNCGHTNKNGERRCEKCDAPLRTPVMKDAGGELTVESTEKGTAFWFFVNSVLFGLSAQAAGNLEGFLGSPGASFIRICCLASGIYCGFRWLGMILEKTTGSDDEGDFFE